MSCGNGANSLSGCPDNYEVDVAALAEATGQRHASAPTAVKRYECKSDSEDVPELGVGTDGGGEKKGMEKKKKSLGSEYYNRTNPFIDDSELPELAIDARTFIAPTKATGILRLSGEVTLIKEKSDWKPKPKSSVVPAPEPIAGPRNYPPALNRTQAQPRGSNDTAIALLSEEETGGKRKSSRGKSKLEEVACRTFLAIPNV